MTKRLFQVLDEMNGADGNNNTSNVAVCNQWTAVNYSAKKGGTEIVLGAPGNLVFDIEMGKLIPILLIINKAEYDKASTSPPPAEPGADDVNVDELNSMLTKAEVHYIDVPKENGIYWIEFNKASDIANKFLQSRTAHHRAELEVLKKENERLKNEASAAGRELYHMTKAGYRVCSDCNTVFKSQERCPECNPLG